jgi:hypothetical protein
VVVDDQNGPWHLVAIVVAPHRPGSTAIHTIRRKSPALERKPRRQMLRL